MDAKITKQRLSNFLAYDWLKILAIVLVAIVGMTLLFTMTATRPSNAQTFTVYAYTDLKTGNDFTNLQQDLEDDEVFSYDILSIGSESFSGNSYAGSIFAVRRSANEGTVMFATATQSTEEKAAKSSIYTNTFENTYSGSSDTDRATCYNPQYFIETEIKNDLALFFGNGLRGAIDENKVQARFLQRNGKDKRFRTKAQKEAGIVQEKARLQKLRDDYLAVVEAFESGKYSYIALDKETGIKTSVAWGEECPEGSYLAAIDVSHLRSVTGLVYYANEENKPTAEDIGLLVFRDPSAKAFDLCYETVSFLNYLVGKYA